MGVHDKNVKVSGELNDVYRILVNMLAVNRYEINGQNPPVQIAASKGSKVITLALGTADYKELNVTLIAAGPGLADVHFHFFFPWKSLLFLTPSERRKHEEGDRMIDTSSSGSWGPPLRWAPTAPWAFLPGSVRGAGQ
jgi:hypothetical protein